LFSKEIQMTVKTTTSYLISLLLTASAIAQVNCAVDIENRVTLIASNTRAIDLEFNLSGINKKEVVTDGEKFDNYFITGEGTTYEFNKPLLPMVSRFVVVPHEAGLELIVKSDEPRYVPAIHPPALCRDEDVAPQIEQIDEGFLYPQVVAEMSEPLVIRGIRLVKVTTYPVQYDQSSQCYVFNDRLETEIRYTNKEPVNPAAYPFRRNRSKEFLKFICALAINGDEVGRDDPDSEPEYIGHYLVVTHANCLEYAAPFIEWRRKAGYKMDILSLPDNISRINTREIKSRIQQRYDSYLDEGIDPFDEILLIGDLSYYLYPPAAGWILAAESGESVWNAPPHADYKYALLEGGENDLYPDVGISRWCAGNPDILNLFVGKTLAYEAEPYMENPAWFTRGAVYSQHWGNSPHGAWHPTIHTNVRWAEEVLQRAGFDYIHFFEDYNYDQDGRNGVGPFVRDRMNEGVNLLLGRAENLYLRGWYNDVIDDNVVFPIRLVLSGHGEYTTYNMMRLGDGDHLRGTVASCTNWGGPPTISTNAVWLELINSMVQRGLTFGWSRLLATTIVQNYFPDFVVADTMRVRVYGHIKTDNDFYGDPGIKPWFGMPRVVEANLPEFITAETRMVEVSVLEAEDSTNVTGAQVTLYAPGDIPAFDDDDYAGYDDMLMWTTKTDLNGIARFVFEDGVEFVDETDVYITITGRDIRPFFHEIEVGTPGVVIELADYELNEDNGNGNGEINPGETFSIALTAENLGDENAVDVSATITSLSSYVEIAGENAVLFGAIEGGGTVDGNRAVVIQISPACPDGESRPVIRPRLSIDFTSGNNHWRSGIELNPAASNFDVREVVNGIIIPTDVDEYELDIDIANIGGMNAPRVSALIVSSGIGIETSRGEAAYPAIEAGDHRTIVGEPFIIRGNPIVVPGSSADMMLILQSENGFVDTAYFELQVGEPHENAPQGPDDYGYICFDDTDSDWELAPEYDWIEISLEDPDRDYDGTLINAFDGRSEHDIGETAVIPLPFTTGFYGKSFDSISVCTNGFICPGNQGRITNFQNWPLDRGIGGGAGMIAPFWDWLRFVPNINSGVYYYFDEEQSRFIIEWYKLRNRPNGETDLTFQVILYDKDEWCVESGDPNILFQYKSVENAAGIFVMQNNIPFASTGISSMDGTTGINYTFRNEYPVTSAALENRRALLFTTSPRDHSGVIYGQVMEAGTDEPVGGLEVSIEYGLTTRTDENGIYTIDYVLTEEPLDVTARKIGYYDATYEDALVRENERLEVNFVVQGGAGADDSRWEVPTEFGLTSVYPNPFNCTTTLRFEIDRTEKAILRAFDIYGREAALLFDGVTQTGSHRVVWDASGLAAGLYLVRLESLERNDAVKVVLMR